MKKSLLRLGWLIATQVEPERIKRKSFSPQQLKSWTDIVHREYDNICLLLLSAYVNVEDEKARESLFHRYQASLVNLLNRVFAYKVLHPESPLTGLYDALMTILEDLLEHLRDGYKELFNQEGIVPDIYQQAARAHLQEQWETLNKLMARHEVPAELIQLALKPIGHLINCRRLNRLTYRFLNYIKILSEELTEWANSSYRNPECKLLCLLVYLNLNSRGLGEYCIKYFVARMEGCVSPTERLFKLEYYYNKVHILLTDQNLAFIPDRPVLKHDLEEWLMAEIAIHRKKVSAHSDTRIAPPVREKEEIKKLKTPFTVIEKAVWALGLMKVGMILNKSMIEVFRAVAGIFESKQQGEMSAESMQKHYKEIDVNSLDMMMGVAMDLYHYFKSLRRGLADGGNDNQGF